jgi:hypothetical protein
MTSPHKKNRKPHKKKSLQFHMNIESLLLSATKTNNFSCSKNCVFKEDHNVFDT